MSTRQSVHHPALVPRTYRHPNSAVEAVPLATTRRTPAFRFFDLPAEIRRYIYTLWIPPSLHVSTGPGRVRLQHFTETRQGLVFASFSIRPFFLNQQFYHEFWYAVFARSTWSFSYPSLLLPSFRALSAATVDRIRRVSIRLGEYGDLATSSSCSTGISKDRSMAFAFRRARQILLHMKQLQTLLIYLHLSDFGYRQTDPRTALPANTLAANCVADFTWAGLETRIPFAKSELGREFVRTLKLRCGDANVSLVPKAEDRYAGPMLDVVISQCAVAVPWAMSQWAVVDL